MSTLLQEYLDRLHRAGNADQLSISFGLTVPLRYWHGRHAAVTFASDMRSAAARADIRKSCLGLEAVATTFHLQACAIFQALHRVSHAILTPREVQCLTWAARKFVSIFRSISVGRSVLSCAISAIALFLADMKRIFRLTLKKPALPSLSK